MFQCGQDSFTRPRSTKELVLTVWPFRPHSKFRTILSPYIRHNQLRGRYKVSPSRLGSKYLLPLQMVQIRMSPIKSLAPASSLPKHLPLTPCQNSLIFLPHEHLIWALNNPTKKPSKRFGNLIKCEEKDLSNMLAKHRDEVKEFVRGKMAGKSGVGGGRGIGGGGGGE